MSGPKCGEYTVVSEAELRRRRLLAAQERFERASLAATAMNARIAAANQTFKQLAEPLFRVTTPASSDPASWESEALRLERAAASVQERLNTRTAHLRAAIFTQGLGGVMSASFASDVPVARRTQTPASPAATRPASERVLAALARLPPDSPCERECQDLASGWAAAPSDGRRELIVSQIKLLVQEEVDRRKVALHRRERLDALQRQLDGLVSDEVRDLKLRIGGHLLDSEIPAELEAAVGRAAAQARSELDRHFVLDAVSEVLADLGYQVGESFGTAVADGGAVLDLTSNARHGVRVRAQDGQLMFNVIRYDDPRDAAADMRAEEAFCRDFSALRSELDSRGVALKMSRADPPGVTVTQLMTTGKPSEKQRGERERDGHVEARRAR